MLLNKYKVETYTFSEFRKQYTNNDINLVDKVISLFVYCFLNSENV